MSNMSYCRFENTLRDLQDCYVNLSDVDSLSESEKKARLQLIMLCANIAEDTAEEVEG